MNDGWILIFCLLTILQIYIYFITGFIGYFRKFMQKSTSKFISQLICTFTFPIYNMLELAKVSTFENMRIFWILMVSTIISILIAFITCRVFCFIFKLDTRVCYSFCLLNS